MIKKGPWVFLILVALVISSWALLAKKLHDSDATIRSTNKLAELLTTTLSEPVIELPPLPASKILPDGTQVFQTFNNCGPASLSMALSHLGVEVSQKTLGDDLRPYQNPSGDNDDKSVTLQEMAAKAQEFGFVAYHRPHGTIDILINLINYDLPVITRTWLKPNDEIGHYRVVKGFDQTHNQLIQDDSLQGANLTYSYQDFLDLWQAFNYEYLVLVPEDKRAIVETILGEDIDEQAAWENALMDAQSQTDDNPSDIYAVFNQSVALYYLQRFDESVALFERVENKLPFRMLWYQIEPILAYQALGDYNRVLQITDKILNNQNRAFSELYQIRAEVYEAQGNMSAAQVEYQKAQVYRQQRE